MMCSAVIPIPAAQLGCRRVRYPRLAPAPCLHGQRLDRRDDDFAALPQPHCPRQSHLQLPQVPAAVHRHNLRDAGGQGEAGWQPGGEKSRGRIPTPPQQTVTLHTPSEQAPARTSLSTISCCGWRIEQTRGPTHQFSAPLNQTRLYTAPTSTFPSIIDCCEGRWLPPFSPPLPLRLPRRSMPVPAKE